MKLRNSHYFEFFAAVAAGALLLTTFPSPTAAQTDAHKGTLVEEIIARVNNQVITLSDYQKAEQELPDQAKEECQGCTPEQIQAQVQDDQKNLLRDMIDQDLLVDRAKDIPDINVDADVIKELDAMRREYNLATIDDLQKAIESQGGDWQEYKDQLRNRLLRQQVIDREVMGRFNISDDDVKAYYKAHTQDFVLPEEVQLAEIFLSTAGKSPEEVAAVRTKAEDLRNRVANKGEDFGEIAKRYSEAPTAQNGGAFGQPFTKDKLAPEIAKVVFAMDKNQITDVIQVQTGFDIFKVVDHTQAGLQPLTAVSDQIRYKIAIGKAQPAIRTYLAQLREENYVVVKPGYTDSAAVAASASDAIQEVAPTPDTPEKKKKKIPLPKVGGQ